MYEQGRNEVYGIRDQRKKMGWDQGSQARDLGSQAGDLGSQAVGSGSVVLRVGSGIKFSDRKSNIIKMTKFTLIGRKELPPFTSSNVFLR